MLFLLQYTRSAICGSRLSLSPSRTNKSKGKAETQLMPGTPVTRQGAKQQASRLMRTVRQNHQLLESINPNVN